MRLVFRDAHIADLERSDKSKNRLSALYVDCKSPSGGDRVRLGRQSPPGGGAMGRLGPTLSNMWQIGASAQMTSIGAIPPVPEGVGFENGRPATGNICSVGGQLIGLNLYSQRDTHVFATTGISSPSLRGPLLSYNNASIVGDMWQVEPSLQ